ncbi:hypothetical protein A2412_03290 [Candidatus Peribacteria bacterium RIFOXYC1_FULL_58_8]|nr:MAG: hypothetical protein A2412_03290 [Candidatus Peribacteria bacterium RIFOXYC1_FULL_58_8]
MAKDKAAEILRQYEIEEPIIPITRLAEKHGLTVKVLQFPETLRDVAGFFDPEQKIIFVNRADPPNRQTFTIAHELGHFILGHKPNEYGVLPRYPRPKEDNPIEKEANCFAASLLVPLDMLKKIMKQYSLNKTDADQELLAGIFGVSTDVIKFRLKWI